MYGNEPSANDATVYPISRKSFACHTPRRIWSTSSSSSSSDGFSLPHCFLIDISLLLGMQMQVYGQSELSFNPHVTRITLVSMLNCTIIASHVRFVFDGCHLVSIFPECRLCSFCYCPTFPVRIPLVLRAPIRFI